MTVIIRTSDGRATAEPLDMLALYRTMVTARVMNDLLKTRKTQGRFPFYISCAGHETMAAVVAALQPEHLRNFLAQTCQELLKSRRHPQCHRS